VITVVVDTDKGDPLEAPPARPGSTAAGPAQGSLTAELLVNGVAVPAARSIERMRARMREREDEREEERDCERMRAT
jgi:hypothetical protein